jgi:hypothetical protein
LKITGPFLDRAKRLNGQPSCWFLRYSTPRTRADGTVILDGVGKPLLKRHRPYYPSKSKAEADKPHIEEQHGTAGAGSFLFDRNAASDYEAARKITGGVLLVEVARFWRLHHPEKPGENCRALYLRYIDEAEARFGTRARDGERKKRTRHIDDLRSRVGSFVKMGFGDRFPETVTQRELLDYLKGLKDCEARTVRNHKNALSAFFGWIRDQQMIANNPAAGIRKRMLPKEQKKEIGFLSLEQVESYLRAAERYAPEMVAHEVVQLVSGVRADDEMGDFRAEFVLPQTKEVVIPAAIAKTGKREVINSLESSFWDWWSVYGPKKGLLRPRNYGPRWDRLRVLASIRNQAEADKLARLPIKSLLKLPVAKAALGRWPWNGRRRTFCTFHIAMHESAAKTALILRHRGSAETLHNSYRGMGVAKEQGRAYFKIMPLPFAKPILPIIEAKGIIRIQREKRHISHRAEKRRGL